MDINEQEERENKVLTEFVSDVEKLVSKYDLRLTSAFRTNEGITIQAFFEDKFPLRSLVVPRNLYL